MGRTMIRAILNSARGVQPNDNSPQAAAARCINGFAELDGIEFIAKVDVEKDAKGEDRNVVKMAIEPDHKEYASIKSSIQSSTSAPILAAPIPAQARPATAPATGKPSWAQ